MILANYICLVPSPSDDSLDLGQVAEEVGVHYQTVYRWVRSGKLTAEMVDGRYQVKRNDLVDLLNARRTPTPPKPPGPPRLARIADKMHTALVTGDELAASDLARVLVTEQTSIVSLIQRVLLPPLQKIGRDRYGGDLQTWVEHRASAIVERVLVEVTPRPRGRRRGTVMVAAVSGDRHTLATTIAAVTLRENNWFVHHLGADMPPDELVRFCDEHAIDVAALTLTNPDCAALVERTGARIKASGTPAIVVGTDHTLEELLERVQDAHR